MKIVVYALLGLWSAICLFPLYWITSTSIKSVDDIYGGPRYLPLVDFVPSGEGWGFIFFGDNEHVGLRLLNSALIAGAATLATILLAAMALYGLTRFPMKRAGSLFAALLATRILPPIVLVIPVYVMAQWTHLLDSRLGLALVYTAINLPVALWLLRPAFGLRASEPEEAALLDGASHAAIFADVLLPMLAVPLAATGLFVFVLCWNEYLFAAFLASDNAMTLPPWLVGQMSIKEAQTGSEAEEWSHFSAATVLMAIPCILFAGAVQRRLARAMIWKN